LCDPFGSASPPLIASSNKTLQAVILNGWPRIRFYKGEILKGLAVCWCRTADEPDMDQRLDIRLGLQRTLALLLAAVADDHDAIEQIEKVLQSDPRLPSLREKF